MNKEAKQEVRWISVNDRLPNEEKYYHTKGTEMVTYWHNDIKRWGMYGVTYWLEEKGAEEAVQPSPEPTAEFILEGWYQMERSDTFSTQFEKDIAFVNFVKGCLQSSHPSPEPEKSNVGDKQEVEVFLNLVELERLDFSRFSMKDAWWLEIPAAKRVVIEDMLIYYDQMLSRLKAASLPKEDEFAFIKERRKNMPQEIKDKVKADFDERDLKEDEGREEQP